MAYLETEQHGILVNGGHIDRDAIGAIQDDWSEAPREGMFGQQPVAISEANFHKAVVIGLIFEDPGRFQQDGTVFFAPTTIEYLRSLNLLSHEASQNNSGEIIEEARNVPL